MYWPGSKPVNEYEPSFEVVAVFVCPVGPVSVTAAFGTTAPLSSKTWPRNPAVWPLATGEVQAATIRQANNLNSGAAARRLMLHLVNVNAGGLGPLTPGRDIQGVHFRGEETCARAFSGWYSRGLRIVVRILLLEN